MTNSCYVESELVTGYLEFNTPPTIRDTLLGDPKFREGYEISACIKITFDEFGVSFERSKLFSAIRIIVVDGSEIEVRDTEDRIWQLRNESKKNQLSLSNSCGKRIILHSYFSVLSPDRTIRLNLLREIASDVNLPTKAREDWRKIISIRFLRDDELTNFVDDICDTPVIFAQSLKLKIASEEISVPSLIPPSRRYFERLIGSYDESSCISNYAVGTSREFFKQLYTWRPFDGFLHSLLLSSHSALTVEMNVEYLDSEDLVCAFNFLENSGDRISQLGAIEIGLRILAEKSELEAPIIRLIRQLQSERVDNPLNGFRLISDLFVLVDGELSRLRLFSTEPPFYRRLAALTQAALITREILAMDLDVDGFCKWAHKNRNEWFYFQNYADIRKEPRWHPEFAQTVRTRAECISRLMTTAKRHEENIKNNELARLVFNDANWELDIHSELLGRYLPGPLDTAENSPIMLPPELLEVVEAQLNNEIITPYSFTALLIFARVFKITPYLLEQTVNSLKNNSHRIGNIENKQQLTTILCGLAALSSMTRSQSLADELRIVVRRYLCNGEFSLTIMESFFICLDAAASREELNEWLEFVGDWLTELAFSDIDRNESELLNFHLRCLMDVVPELWTTCGRAEAALSAYTAAS